MNNLCRAVLTVAGILVPFSAIAEWINHTESKSIAASGTENVYVECPPGMTVVSGGFRLSSNAGYVQVVGSRPVDEKGWIAFFFNSAHYALKTEMTVYANCMPAAPVAPPPPAP